MNTQMLHLRRLSLSSVGLLFLAGTLAFAQDDASNIPRALPVQPGEGNAPLTPPAVPFEDAPPVPIPGTPAPPPQSTSDDEEIRLAPAESAGQQSPEQILFDLANGLYSRKNYEYAAAEYEKLIAEYGGGPPAMRQAALFRLAECYRVLGRKNEARDLYEDVLVNFQQGDFVGPSAFRLANLYFEVGNARQALPLFRQAARMTNAKEIKLASRYYEAKCLEQLERGVETLEVYRELVAVDQDNPYLEASRRAFANKALNFGRLTDALEQYKLLIEETDTPAVRAEATLQAALIAQQLAKNDEALAFYEKALADEALGEARSTAETGYFQLLEKTGNVIKLQEEYEKRKDSLSEEALPEILLAVANALNTEKKYAEAAQLYGDLRERFPKSQAGEDARFQELVMRFYSGEENLDELIEEYLDSDPPEQRAAQAQLIQAEAHFRQQDWRKAGAIYASLLDAELPRNQRAELLFKLGWCYGKIENYERVGEVLTEYVQQHPDHPLMASALAQRALAYQQLKRFDDALLDFGKLLRNYPDARERPVALQQQALILGQQGDNAGMIRHFTQLLEEYPESAASAQANYWTGWAYFESKEFADAIAYLEKARELNPEEYGPRASLRLVLSNFYLENLPALEKEVDAYQSAGYEPPVQLEVLRYLGTQLLAQGETAKAEKYLAEALRKSGDDPELTRTLARVQLEAGQPAKAVETIKKYLTLVEDGSPKAQGLLLLAKAQLAAQDYSGARESAEQVLQLQPQGRLNAEGRILIGEVEMAQNDYEAAAKSFLSVAVLYEDVRLTPKAIDQAMVAYEKLGNTPEVERLRQELRRRYPNYERE